MSSFENLKEKLAGKKKCYSSLHDRNISDKDYQHFFNVWKKIEIKTMKDYHEFYLKGDNLLLADVFAKFRNNTLEELWIMSN